MEGPTLCCRELELREFPDKYMLRSLDPSFPGLAVSASRYDGSIRTCAGDNDGLESGENPSKVSTVYGIAGVIKLLAGTYILVITSRKEAGTYFGTCVYRVHSMRFLSCNEALKVATSQEKNDEAHFMSLLRIVEATPGLYYSYNKDLTLNLQRTSKLVEERNHKPLWKQADPQFVWNRYLLEELIETRVDEFIVPLIQGSFQTMQFILADKPVTVSLISRRCNRRLGTRMWRRGANLDGAVANFVETEQLVEFKEFKSSFLQVRGSVPLIWEQIVDLSYKPHLNIIHHEETSKVVQRHFHDLTQRYGEIAAVDLTDEQGEENLLSQAYASEIEKLSHIRYVHFDFHHACGKANFENLGCLYDQIKENFEKQGLSRRNEIGANRGS